MAASPLYVAPRPFAWDFSGLFNDVVQRGQIGLQLAASGASRSRSTSPKSTDFEYKGEAAWWANEHGAERAARSGMLGLLQEHQNDYQGAMADPRFVEYVSVINQARNHPRNEFRGQQLEKKKKFEDQYKDRKSELVVVDGKLFPNPSGNNEPATVSKYLEHGTFNPDGADLNWASETTDSKGFEEGLEKTFSSLRFNEAKQPSLSLDTVPTDIGQSMNVFLNTSYGHKSNSAQMNDALNEATKSMFETRKNDVIAWYMRTEDYKSRRNKPTSEGGFLNGKEIDSNAVGDAIFYQEPIKNDAGEVVALKPSGWFPDRLRDMARKHRWVSNSETVSGSAKTVSKQMEDMIDSKPFLDTFQGVFASGGEDQRGYFYQNMGPGGIKARTDNRAGYLLRDATEMNAVNKRLKYGEMKEGKGWQPLDEYFDGAVTIPGFMFKDGQRGEQNYFKPLLSDMNVQASEPSNKMWIGTDVTKVPGDKPLGEDDKTDKALYHTFKNGMAIPLDELREMNPIIAMPNSAEVNEFVQKNSDFKPLTQEEINQDIMYRQSRGFTGKPARKNDSATKTRIAPTDFNNFSKISIDELLEDRLDDYNNLFSEDLKVMTKAEMREKGIPLGEAFDMSDDSREFLISKNAMVQTSAMALKNLELYPKTETGKAALAHPDVNNDPNKLLNMRGVQMASPSDAPLWFDNLK